jgi:hypothetical protein
VVRFARESLNSIPNYLKPREFCSFAILLL